MGIHYLRDMPPHALVETAERYVVLGSVFCQIGDYTRSRPTGPTPGRIYRKNLHWSGPPANWFIFICEPDPEPGPRGETMVLHRGKKAVILGGARS